jgi:hypothetical protein
MLKMKVDIPCPGHAPLISGELKSLDGVVSVKYSSGHTFDVYYDSSKVLSKDMLALKVFQTYTPTVLEEKMSAISVSDIGDPAGGNSGQIATGCGGSCGGGCGSGGSGCGCGG